MGLWVEKNRAEGRQIIRVEMVKGVRMFGSAIFLGELNRATRNRTILFTAPSENGWEEWLKENYPDGVRRGLFDQIPTTTEQPREIWAYDKATLNHNLNEIWFAHRLPVDHYKRR